ncbi:ABC transporter permease [Legionella sp. CNM-1927-20]|uniref:ABC transporter permease n=1 Tax=Legionella sp. CNM-1927-20 TaxID=3422221 RepID=UPI00403B331F
MTSHSMRYSWQVMYASVFALVIRDIQKKFIKTVNTERSIGFIWVILEPIMHIGIWMLIRMVFNRNTHTLIPTPLFILLGVIPFLLFRNIISSSKISIKANKNFYLFRQVRPLDPILAKIISEIMISVFIFLILLAGLRWFGIKWFLYDFTTLLFNSLSFVGFILGLSLIIAIACFFFNFIATVISIVNRMTYILSGVFFSADMLPQPVRNIALYNPVFQFIEILRESFTPPFSFTPYTSSEYLLKISLIILAIGFALYLAAYQKIMIEIEQR